MGYQGTPNDGWIEKGSADNATATATKAAAAGKRHYITSVSGSFTAAAAGKVLTLKDGTTVLGEWAVHNQFDQAFPLPIRATLGNAVSAELAASGTAGVLGKVTITGFTDPD